MDTGEFLKSLALDSFMNGGDITGSLNKLKSEMAKGLAEQAKSPKKGKPAKARDPHDYDDVEPEAIDTEGEEVKDASDFASKYGRKR